MITLEDDTLVFRFPDVHADAGTALEFERTLRIPDDGKDYPLPPGLGRFPLRHMEDYAARVPAAWNERASVLLPMYQAEAMWISFGDRWPRNYPCAVKICAGKINAVTGEAWSAGLSADPQDYIVAPDQPWLDGFAVEKGIIRQFVAMPLGSGYSVEEQLTREAEHGGLQIVVYPMKVERYLQLLEERQRVQHLDAGSVMFAIGGGGDMGLAAGGRMRQEIYEDHYGIDAWDQSVSSRCFVTIANAVQWLAITGQRPPSEPVTAAAYAEVGLPWFDYYDADAKALEGAPALAKVKSVAEVAKDQGEGGFEEEPLPPLPVIGLRRRPKAPPRPVRKGTF